MPVIYTLSLSENVKKLTAILFGLPVISYNVICNCICKTEMSTI